MKKYLLKVCLLLMIVTGFAAVADAQIIVNIRPTPPLFVRPIAPSPRHIWIEGEWIGRGNRYEYANGYWALPDRGRNWVPGHWKFKRRGWVWVPGHWQHGGRRGRW